jgi:1,6-anhydro-N-acetylmuramate kinase
MSVIITEVVILEVEDWSGGGAGGPLVSPAKAAELPSTRTQTNTRAFNDFSIGTSIATES